MGVIRSCHKSAEAQTPHVRSNSARSESRARVGLESISISKRYPVECVELIWIEEIAGEEHWKQEDDLPFELHAVNKTFCCFFEVFGLQINEARREPKTDMASIA